MKIEHGFCEYCFEPLTADKYLKEEDSLDKEDWSYCNECDRHAMLVTLEVLEQRLIDEYGKLGKLIVTLFRSSK